MLAGDVLRLAEDGAVDRRHVGGVAAALRPGAAVARCIAVERGFVLEDADGTLTPLPEVWADDRRPDERGRLRSRRPVLLRLDGLRPGARAPASLYRLDPDGSVHEVLDGVTISNGLEWSPDGSLAYYDDTATHRDRRLRLRRDRRADRAASLRRTSGRRRRPTA